MAKLAQMMGLVIVAFLARCLFLGYRAIPFALVTGLGFYLVGQLWWPELDSGPWETATLVSAVFLALITHKSPAVDNRYRKYVGWKGWMEARGDGLIAWIGTIKYFNSPYSLVEDPGSYKIGGEEVRELIDTVLRPGDILLRGFDGYLDGLMISGSGGGAGKGSHFSHAALYVGSLQDEKDRPLVARRLQVLDDKGRWIGATLAQQDAVRTDPEYYTPGRQMVVHAMTKGVYSQDILTFLRCDYLAVLRLPESFNLTAAEMHADRSVIKNLESEPKRIKDDLMAGKTITAAEVLAQVHCSALEKIGSCYDFQFTDAKNHHRYSCSEFVYYCFRSIHCYIGLKLKRHAFLNVFFPRTTITPADVFDAAITQKKLQVVYMSKSLT